MQQVQTGHLRLPERLVVRVPPGVTEAVEIAARSKLMSSAEFLRSIVVKATKDAGVTIYAGGRVEVRA